MIRSEYEISIILEDEMDNEILSILRTREEGIKRAHGLESGRAQFSSRAYSLLVI